MLNFYSFKQDYLKFEGSDRLGLINRLSTNQVNNLQKNNGIKTVLTNDKGRFVDVLTLYNFGDFIFSTCSVNNASNVIAHLDKYTIMDDFVPVNMAGIYETILFYGENAGSFINEIFTINVSNFINNDFEIFNMDGHDSIVAKNDDRFGGYMFIFPESDNDYWVSYIFKSKNITRYDPKEINDTEYDKKRISLGIPAFGKEITEITNPLECRLTSYVSFTKGCYLGQEVIARLDTYDKISKHLVKIETKQSFQQNGSKILIDGKECGFVTSAIKNSGLGFIKTIFLDYNKTYKIKNIEPEIDCKIIQINN